MADGGPTTEENLWLACRRCNEFKGSRTRARDPQTGIMKTLFNPRKQIWSEHFVWSKDGGEIIGKTACGRA
ncbi:MAG: HNH endonuclease, partial [Deltaproteobacteria bacterium]|nr:HNH endonuclease [Deltaproteobacteria bacterium]